MSHPAGWEITWGTLTWFLLNGLAVATIPSVLVHRRGRPLSALAWLFALIGLPGLGILAWWVTGRRRLARIQRRRATARDTMDRRFSALSRRIQTAPLRRFEPMVLSPHLPDEELGRLFPTTRDNQVEVLVDAAEVYPAMLQAIDGAKRHLHVQFYIWEPDETGRLFRDRLIAKAKEGVEVRVLIDGFGGSAVVGAFMQPLIAAGGKVDFFLPTRLFRRQITINFRNHRKILIADGMTGFIGGLNIGDEYTRDWHDIGIRLDGLVVEQLQEVFADDWYFTTGENLAEPAYFGHAHPQNPYDLRQSERCQLARCRVMASGPDTRQNANHDALFIGITATRQRLWITTPYFIPDTALQTALRTAAYRGVDVRLLLPRRSDVPFVRLASRSYYGDLLAAGVRIFEYDGAILHSKSVLIDDDVAIVGSANLDIRSLQLNFEANCIIDSQAVNHRLADLFERNLKQSVEIHPAELHNRRLWDVLLENTAHLLSPLL